MTTMTHKEWVAEAKRRFGDSPDQWKFVCPVCGCVASVADWTKAGAPEGAIAFSCVGRWLSGAKDAFSRGGTGPCNYAGGGLIRLNPITVKYPDGTTHEVFDFAPADEAQEG